MKHIFLTLILSLLVSSCASTPQSMRTFGNIDTHEGQASIVFKTLNIKCSLQEETGKYRIENTYELDGQTTTAYTEIVGDGTYKQEASQTLALTAFQKSGGRAENVIVVSAWKEPATLIECDMTMTINLYQEGSTSPDYTARLKWKDSKQYVQHFKGARP